VRFKYDAFSSPPLPVAPHAFPGGQHATLQQVRQTIDAGDGWKSGGSDVSFMSTLYAVCHGSFPLAIKDLTRMMSVSVCHPAGCGKLEASTDDRSVIMEEKRR